MVGRKLPVFQKGKILTKEMLQSLRDYVVCEGETAYRDYADGILYGCQVTATQDVITVHPGAIVMAGVVYYLTEAISVEYAPANQWMILKIRAGEQSISENFELFGLEIVLEPETALKESEIELCRFKLQQGARLRTVYRDFADLDTEFDTLNFKYARWAAYKYTSVAPLILWLFYEEAMRKDNLSEKQYQFCMQIASMKQETLNNQAISLFISNELGRAYKILTSEDVYDGLLEVLGSSGAKRSSLSQRAFRERRMIVD